MAGTLKKVRFKLAWQQYRVGDEITPSGTMRDWLVSNGYVEIVEDDKSPVRRNGTNRMASPTHRRSGAGN